MWQSVAQISAQLRIHVVTLYNWMMAWRLQGEVVPVSEKEPEAGVQPSTSAGAGAWPTACCGGKAGW